MKSWFLNRINARLILGGSLSLLFAAASAQTTTFNYTGAAQSYVVPSGQSHRVTIRIWGAGGAGETRTFTNNSAGSGGGGGAYAQVTVTLTPGTYAVNVGSGSADGTASSFTIRSSFPSFVVSANGGYSGGNFFNSGNGGAAQDGFTTGLWSVYGASGIVNRGGGNGNNGDDGNGGYGGGGGGAAGAGGNGNNAPNRTHGNGNSGVSGDGVGGNGGDGANSGTNAVVGVVPGGGGGGGFRQNSNNNRAGGSGGNGRVEVTIEQVLPVQFEAVTATTSGNELLVNFTTLEEINNDHFNIQASEDGKDFQTIATVKSKHAGAVFTGSTAYAVRIDKNGNAALLGLSVLAVAALGFAGARRNRKMFMAAILGYILIGVAAVSCSKNSAEITTEESGRKGFIRIEQVDVDGHSSYSKIVAVVRE